MILEFQNAQSVLLTGNAKRLCDTIVSVHATTKCTSVQQTGRSLSGIGVSTVPILLITPENFVRGFPCGNREKFLAMDIFNLVYTELPVIMG
jgi:hypothetical protein